MEKGYSMAPHAIGTQEKVKLANGQTITVVYEGHGEWVHKVFGRKPQTWHKTASGWVRVS